MLKAGFRSSKTKQRESLHVIIKPLAHDLGGIVTCILRKLEI